MKFKHSQVIAGNNIGDRHEYKKVCHIKYEGDFYKVQLWEGIGKAKNKYKQIGKVEIKKIQGYKTEVEVEASHNSGFTIDSGLRHISPKTYQSKIDEAIALIVAAIPAEGTRYFVQRGYGGAHYYSCFENSECKLIVLQELYFDESLVRLTDYHFDFTFPYQEESEEITKEQYTSQFKTLQRTAVLLKEKSLLDELIDRQYVMMHIGERFNVDFGRLQSFVAEPDSWKYERGFLHHYIEDMDSRKGYKSYRIDVRYREIFQEKLAEINFKNRSGELVKFEGDDFIIEDTILS